MDYQIIKTYVCVETPKGRLELKFLGGAPTNEEIQAKVDEVTAPAPEPQGCPMNNKNCPLYVPSGVEPKEIS